MSIYRITGQNLEKMERTLKKWNETLIWSCLQGVMGTAWSTSEIDFKSAQFLIGDFCFFAGEPNEELVKNKPYEFNSDFVIMVPQNKEWAALIQDIYGENAVQITRYAIKKEPNVFNTKKLKSILDSVSGEYEIRFIDEEIYNITKNNKWSSDLCSQFKDYYSYSKIGLGVVAVHNGEVVSGASSYTVYRDGIEIEVDTREDYRRKGLALVCSAKLILECINRNLYPSWDAQNLSSVALAEKLGYHFDKEYTAFEVQEFGKK